MGLLVKPPVETGRPKAQPAAASARRSECHARSHKYDTGTLSIQVPPPDRHTLTPDLPFQRGTVEISLLPHAAHVVFPPFGNKLPGTAENSIPSEALQLRASLTVGSSLDTLRSERPGVMVRSKIRCVSRAALGSRNTLKK